MKLHLLLKIVILLLIFWTIVLKVISRIAAIFGSAAPCPASLSWMVENPVRRRYMQPVVDWFGIKPGEKVLELGPGPGVFTVPSARRVGARGIIIALDIQPAMIDSLITKLMHANLTNVLPCVADAQDLPLPSQSVDRALLVSVLDEIPDPKRALVQLNRVLKPSGVLSITSEFLDPDYRFLFELKHILEPAGFLLLESHGNFWRYTANFQKRADLPLQPESGIDRLCNTSQTVSKVVY